MDWFFKGQPLLDYDGEFVTISAGLALAVFNGGDYSAYLEDLSKLLSDRKFLIYNVNSNLNPKGCAQFRHRVLDCWYPRTSSNMPTLQNLFAFCASAASLEALGQLAVLLALDV